MKGKVKTKATTSQQMKGDGKKKWTMSNA